MHRKIALVLGFVTLDALVGAVALPLAYWLRLGGPVFVWPPDSPWPTDVTTSFGPYVALNLVAPVALVVSGLLCSLYRGRGTGADPGGGVALAKAATLGALLVVGCGAMYRGGFVHRNYEYSRGVYVLYWVVVLALMAGVRLVPWALQPRRATPDVVRSGSS
jgi:hypothetical protein